ncbi:hypothetical protein AAON49_01125 [Pseudotenacibaculum sp. MALMAid0570]|uniref:hypothetical protein n=1 Tax=Pseudotenacibaculum sp. MALMAid0570 TaxID=3143938 RepID=UPI0032DE4147
MRKNVFLVFVISLALFFSCDNSKKFQIKKGQVGLLTTKTTVQDLNHIFKNDSIVKNLSEGSLGDRFFQDDDEYLVYEKGGKHLLTIVPKEQLDSTSTIKSVQIFDKRFKTEKGLNLNSTFAEVNMNNNIDKIESTLASATLFIDELNATISIDKEELGLKAFSNQQVTKEQIPDLAKMKSFTIWFN